MLVREIVPYWNRPSFKCQLCGRCFDSYQGVETHAAHQHGEEHVGGGFILTLDQAKRRMMEHGFGKGDYRG